MERRNINQKGVGLIALTDKQKRFCDEYLIDLNATQAALRAGYSKKTAKQIGQQNLTKLDLKNYIDKRMKEKESELVANQDEVLKYLTAVLRGETTAQEIVVEGTGDGCSKAKTMKKAPSEKERLRAAELLGKRYALFTDKVETDVDMDLNITIDYGEDDTG
ncbi:terminase small subunit [Anaerostipes sp.]|uniref:Terminase small subunit n=1 Tax=Myoviridae sp. ctzwE5 TaxID=2825214 RepID=A0A8S5PX71_9CAUD|nr:terminase small subunit [Anaerostipes sp.]MED9814701.1 terminase small subunit [Anaerostipes sp.]DAE11053.1 MAG TPA: Terminase small subunit [Myoviridae sp. ctzwE5]